MCRSRSLSAQASQLELSAELLWLPQPPRMMHEASFLGPVHPEAELSAQANQCVPRLGFGHVRMVRTCEIWIVSCNGLSCLRGAKVP